MDGIKSLRDARHIDKMFYIGADDLFYEPFDVHYEPSDEFASLASAIIRDSGVDWEIIRKGVWSHVRPTSGEKARLPAQGWKIHISAAGVNCADILRRVTALALENEVIFKFANDLNTLRLMTSKRWSRGASGKFITLYPSGDKAFHDIIDQLYILIKDEAGSYILSDNRYKDCRCIYYRYGGILQTERLNIMGMALPILTSPDGAEIVDARTPYFNPPPWAKDPFPVTEEDQPEMTLNHGRFVVKRALAFSNTGGVYLAEDRTSGKDVVIKEARPYVELHGEGRDAISRLRQEAKMLGVVDGLVIAPSPITTFSDWENFYLVEEYFDATDIREVMLFNSPLLKVYPSVGDSEIFYNICKSIFISLLKAVDAFHSRGVVIGDLSAVNILVDKRTYTVRIIDLEAAYQPGVDSPSDIYTPGFRSAAKGRQRKGEYSDDLYGVAAIMIYSMFPIVAISYLRDDLFEKIVPVLLVDIGWGQTHLLEVVHGLATDTMSCQRARELLEQPIVFEVPLTAEKSQQSHQSMAPARCYQELAEFLCHNYRTEGKVTLFPTDPFALHTNAMGLGFGASGILYCLNKCGFPIPEPALQRYEMEIRELVRMDIAPGILTGASGIALTLFELGDLLSAEKFVDFANSSHLLDNHHSLYYGKAGVGLTNLFAYLRTGKREYLEHAVTLAGRLAAEAIDDERGVRWEEKGVIHLGFGYGQSGVALFFLRLSQVLNESSWLDLGRKALNYDLSFGNEIEPGVLTFPRTPEDVTMYEQYIEEGSAGVARVAIRYGLWDDVDRILADVYRKYSAFAGLLYGLSGFIDVLVDAYRYSGNGKYLDMAKRPLQGILDLYFIKQKHGYATPGENLFRISCDYATGVAGVMRSIYRLEHLVPADFMIDELDNRAHATSSRL